MPSITTLGDTIFNLDGSASSTKADATASVDDAALMGQNILTWTPSTNTSGTFVTGRMDKVITDTTNGNVASTDHSIGHYTYCVYQGNGTVGYGFGDEVKLDINGTTTVSNFSFFKPAVEDIAGTVTNLIMVDCAMDLSGISGTVTNKYSIYSPDTDAIMVNKGGFLGQTTIFPAGNVTLDDSYSGATIYFLTGSTQTVNVPNTLSEGFKPVTVVQGDGNQITVAGTGGLTVFGADGKTKTRTTSSVIVINVINTVAAYVSGDSAA